MAGLLNLDRVEDAVLSGDQILDLGGLDCRVVILLLILELREARAELEARR